MGMCALHSICKVTTNRPSLQILILQIQLNLMKYHGNIYGGKKMKNPYVIIRHMCRDWTTLFIEWQMYGNYIVDADEKIKGTFTFDQTGIHISGIFVGSRVNNTQFLTGAISGIEMYYTRRKENELSNPLKQLIIQNQMVVTKNMHISRRLTNH